jgi:endonuclease/exonuclease/phosphatase family metal-dependent hydrolase
VSGSIEVERRWALSHPVSDHLPVAASIRLPANFGSAAKS